MRLDLTILARFIKLSVSRNYGPALANFKNIELAF